MTNQTLDENNIGAASVPSAGVTAITSRPGEPPATAPQANKTNSKNING